MFVFKNGKNGKKGTTSGHVKKAPHPFIYKGFRLSWTSLDVVPFLPKLRLKTFPEFLMWYLLVQNQLGTTSAKLENFLAKIFGFGKSCYLLQNGAKCMTKKTGLR